MARDLCDRYPNSYRRTPSRDGYTNHHRRLPGVASHAAGQKCPLLRDQPSLLVTCGQRDYGVDGMIGLEPSVDEWVAEMVAVFAEVRRVLRDDGTLWLNLGDKYAGSGGAGGDYAPGGLKAGQTGGPAASPARTSFRRDKAEVAGPAHPRVNGLKAKDLMGLPWRVAFALQAAGWWLRSDIIWSKPNPMPSSVTDRPSTAHEYVFLLTKSARYFYDTDATREVQKPGTKNRIAAGFPDRYQDAPDGNGYRGPFGGKTGQTFNPAGRNRRSVWTIPTAPFKGDHYATYPPALVEPCIKAGTSERGVCPDCGAPWARVVDVDYETAGLNNNSGAHKGASHEGTMASRPYETRKLRHATTTGWRPTCDHDAEPIPATVLDPFSGAGTTGLVAQRLGRDYIGLELNPKYAEMSRQRIHDDRYTKEEVAGIANGQASMFDIEGVS